MGQVTCPNSALLQKEIKATFSGTKFFIKLLAKRLGATSNKQYSMAEKINSKQDAEYCIKDFYMQNVPVELFHVCVVPIHFLLVRIWLELGRLGVFRRLLRHIINNFN